MPIPEVGWHTVWPLAKWILLQIGPAQIVLSVRQPPRWPMHLRTFCDAIGNGGNVRAGINAHGGIHPTLEARTATYINLRNCHRVRRARTKLRLQIKLWFLAFRCQLRRAGKRKQYITHAHFSTPPHGLCECGNGPRDLTADNNHKITDKRTATAPPPIRVPNCSSKITTRTNMKLRPRDVNEIQQVNKLNQKSTFEEINIKINYWSQLVLH